MSSYTTTDVVHLLAADLDLPVLEVDAEVLMRVIERASSDVERVMGQRAVDLGALTVEQTAALSAATAWQTLFLVQQGADTEVGVDDLLVSTPFLAFAAPGRAPRIAPRAIELLAGTGLIVRSGTIPPPLDPEL